MFNRYPKVAPYVLLVKLKDFVVDDICRNAIEGHSGCKKHNLGALLPKRTTMGGFVLIGKAVIIVLMLSNSPQDDRTEVFTSVGVVESMGDSRAVLAACESHGLSLLREFPDVVLGYSCELLREGKDL